MCSSSYQRFSSSSCSGSTSTMTTRRPPRFSLPARFSLCSFIWQRLSDMTDDRPPTARASGRRVVVITGAARGIGLGIARAFAAHQDALALVDLDREIEPVAASLRDDGADVIACTADVAERAEVARAIEQVAERWGRIDVLVNNAQAGGNPAPVVDTTAEHLDLAWRSGFVGTFNAMQLAFPH